MVFVDFAFYKMFHNVNGVMATVKVIANEVERSAEIAANKLNKNQNKTWKQHAADYSALQIKPTFLHFIE